MGGRTHNITGRGGGIRAAVAVSGAREMASVSAANLSTKAKDVSLKGSFLVPAFSEEVISNKDPRSWSDLPEHLLLRVFDTLAKDDADDGLKWVSRAGRVCKMWRKISQELLLGDTAASRPKR